MQVIIFGLASALFWGAGDFAGGIVSRKVNAIRATLYVQAGGFLPVILLALFLNLLDMPPTDWLWCTVAGVIGSLGFLALYRALASGQMSIAAPIAAVTSAGVPAIVGIIRDGIPSALTLAGFLFALIAIWFISQSGQNATSLKLSHILLPFLAGLGFGIYFIFIDQGADEPARSDCGRPRGRRADTAHRGCPQKRTSSPLSPDLAYGHSKRQR